MLAAPCIAKLDRAVAPRSQPPTAGLSSAGDQVDSGRLGASSRSRVAFWPRCDWLCIAICVNASPTVIVSGFLDDMALATLQEQAAKGIRVGSRVST